MTDEASHTVPSAESPDTGRPEETSEEEPNTTGTVFLMMIFLMMIFGFWVIMYVLLLNR